MNGWTYARLVGKYKKCPKCGSKENLVSSLKDEIITVKCTCGWCIKVDEHNKEVK